MNDAGLSERGQWHLVGRFGKVDVFDLHPLLLRQFRLYRRWQREEALRNRAIRQALEDEDTAYVLLTRNGKRTRPETIAKMLKWRAIRAGVAVKDSTARWDAPGGKTSKLSPHAMRRGWADIALNDHDTPLDVVAEVLKHTETSTTRRHYARTKPERARAALLSHTI